MLLNKRIDIPDDWYHKLKHFIESDKFTSLGRQIAEVRKTTTVYPPKEEVFKAFQLTPFRQVQVVILGMDPYPGVYQGKPVACGLAFAPRNTEFTTPSLRKIYDRVKEDFYMNELSFPVDLNLHKWARQGVLLLNTALTVEAGKSGSHMKLWSEWTEEVLKALNEHNTDVIFCFWGKDAVKHAHLIGENNIVLTSPHPMAAHYSGSQWDCDHFIKINEHLKKQNNHPIKWIN
jgi:uracil-DNA glycosylase